MQVLSRVLTTQPDDPEKVASRYELQAPCIVKGQEYEKYEFGNKIFLFIPATAGSLYER